MPLQKRNLGATNRFTKIVAIQLYSKRLEQQLKC